MQKQVICIVAALLYGVKYYKYTYIAAVYSEYVMLGLFQLKIRSGAHTFLSACYS